MATATTQSGVRKGPAPRPLEDRINRFNIAPSGCWEWSGAISPYGYGSLSLNGKGIGAHRVAYMVWRGEIPEGLHVLHRCDNRCCINPDHLFLGTHRDNMRDMAAKGRQALQVSPMTHCRRGHPLDASNTISRPSRTGRGCLICTKMMRSLRSADPAFKAAEAQRMAQRRAAKAASAVASRTDWGVRFSGMSDEKPWPVSPELQARINADYLKAKAAQEAEIEQLIAERRWAERREGHAA